MASKVYWADLRADYRENLPQKLTRLMKTAGMGQIDFEDKFAAIKLHFGEPGNLAFLRPNWAKAEADFVKERGGNPFLTDCNTLYYSISHSLPLPICLERSDRRSCWRRVRICLLSCCTLGRASPLPLPAPPSASIPPIC